MGEIIYFDSMGFFYNVRKQSYTVIHYFIMKLAKVMNSNKKQRKKEFSKWQEKYGKNAWFCGKIGLFFSFCGHRWNVQQEMNFKISVLTRNSLEALLAPTILLLHLNECLMTSVRTQDIKRWRKHLEKKTWTLDPLAQNHCYDQFHTCFYSLQSLCYCVSMNIWWLLSKPRILIVGAIRIIITGVRPEDNGALASESRCH